MNHGLPEGSILAIRGILAGFPEVEKAVLYGSRAMGNFRRGSDIDLTLMGDRLNTTLLSRIDWALDDLLLPYKMDLSLFSQLRHPALLEHIRRVGVPLYERSLPDDSPLNPVTPSNG